MVRALGLLLGMAPSLVLAHPGHGETDPGSIAHFAFEPLHAVPVALLLIAVVASSLVLWRRMRAQAAAPARKNSPR
jgi:hypothetical protein